jgi:arylsulfatase A-like enzyme
MKSVDELGLRENTIFIFTSDHGEMFGSHGRKGKNIFYEEAVRVPFLLRWLNKTKEGSETDVLLNTVDIMPTLLAMLDLPVPDEVEGIDLSPFAFGEPGSEPETAFLQCTGATAKWADGHEWRALRSKQYTYAIYRVDRNELQFDHQADPYQQRNLAELPEYAPVMEWFRKRLAEKMEQVNDTFECCTWYEKHWVEDRKIMRTATVG